VKPELPTFFAELFNPGPIYYDSCLERRFPAVEFVLIPARKDYNFSELKN
jgi:hypothetical protein